MKFGVREICDVVLRAKAIQKIGNKVFYKDEPVLYFDSLKTSSLEGAATTVYAQGGRGNSRLIAWEGERTVTFTMEDALISPAGFSILSGAGLVAASEDNLINVHQTERTNKVVVAGSEGARTATITLSAAPAYTIVNNARSYDKTSIYVMKVYNDEIVSEPYLPSTVTEIKDSEDKVIGATIVINEAVTAPYDVEHAGENPKNDWVFGDAGTTDNIVLVDYYVTKDSGVQQIDITPDKFGGNYYLEASTLFRDTNGVDLPAEFIIPNCKIQSNFTFSMASSGDPSTFTFTMDAFPDYTRFDPTKKVLASIQIIDATTEAATKTRTGSTGWSASENEDASREKTWTGFEPANG